MKTQSVKHFVRNASIFSVVMMAVIACTGTFDDPFVASNKIGTVYEGQNLNLDEANSKSVVLIRVGSSSDTLIESNGTVRLQEGSRLSWSELIITDQQGKSTKIAYSALASDQSCVTNSSDVRELLSVYKSLTAVCAKDVIAELAAASSIKLVGENGKEYDFSSWGNGLHSLGLTFARIYSLSL